MRSASQPCRQYTSPHADCPVLRAGSLHGLPLRMHERALAVAESVRGPVDGPVMSTLRVMDNGVMLGRRSLGLRGGPSRRAVRLFSDAG